jgi:hypothetical protein
MLAKVCPAAVNGIEAYPVEVEVNAGYGDTIVVIRGSPGVATKEPQRASRSTLRHPSPTVRWSLHIRHSAISLCP